MPRLKHVVSGVIVSVDDETAANLGSEWTAADAKDEKPSSRRKI